jgi:hypothetical protein
MRSTHTIDQEIVASMLKFEESPANVAPPVAGLNTSVRAARNHPMAAQVWTYNLAKAAIGWLE